MPKHTLAAIYFMKDIFMRAMRIIRVLPNREILQYLLR